MPVFLYEHIYTDKILLKIITQLTLFFNTEFIFNDDLLQNTLTPLTYHV